MNTSGISSPPNPPRPEVFPDFFIAGAPKCGTSALFEYLGAHPEIAPSALKEPFYWTPEFRSRNQILDPAVYSRLWDGARPGTLKVEGSPVYLQSRFAIPTILRVLPNARFIVLLRKPSEMAYAWHAQLIRSGDEDVADFATAWRLMGDRRNGRRIPRACIDPTRLQYADVCALGDQLERFVAWVPAGNRLTLLYDELAADPRAVYLRALDFLGVADDGRQSFARVNENVHIRSVRLDRMHRRIPEILGPLYAPLRRTSTRMGISPSAILKRLNRAVAPRPPLPPVFKDELVDAFRPQVEKVEALLGRDLSHWKS